MLTHFAFSVAAECHAESVVSQIPSLSLLQAVCWQLPQIIVAYSVKR